MGHPTHHHHINYVEFPASDIQRAKQFYGRVFGWAFQDWGEEYVIFNHGTAGIDGGFRKTAERQGSGAPLVVLYSADLKATEAAIVAAGGAVVVPTFEFPGGRRFHFTDGVGNTLAVWSE
jgi:predicted enzyme related to lactoylglutathione lyase